jgi:hypothetical protein
MNRRSNFTSSAIAALVLAALPSGVAQQGSLRQQLVGNWTLVSYDRTAANGAKTQLFGANPKGILMAHGR